LDRARPRREEEEALEPNALDEPRFKALVVFLILSKDTEKAVELVSKKFRVTPPKLGIGMTKGKKRALAVYSVAANSITFSDQDHFFDPFVVLHEMYHCVRSKSGSHRGTEKNADRFALDYIQEYNTVAKRAVAFKGYSVD
jgi:hypothetical protein